MRVRYNIFHVITTLSYGGAEAMLYRLLSHLSKNTSFQHSVVSLTGLGVHGPRLIEMGTPVYCLHMKGGRPEFRTLTKLYLLLKEYRPCVLQTWLYHADLLGLIVGRLARVPRIVWNVRCSNMDFRYYARTTLWIFALLSRLSRIPDAVVVNSEAGRQFHSQVGYNPRRWEVIPNGFEIERHKPDTEARTRYRLSVGLDESVRVIGMVARYDPMKDHATFFAAARRLSDVLPDVCFVLVGKGMDEGNNDIKEMIQKNGLRDRTYLLGERVDAPDIFPAFDINTLSSSFGEGFSNVLGEAMACGVPCVSTNVGDSAYIIGDTGKVVPSKNSTALAQAWFELLSIAPEQRSELGLKARRRIEGEFSISNVAQRYEKLYLELV